MPDSGPSFEPAPVLPSADAESLAPDFRWRALFQRTRDALFVLNRQRRFLFVNTAWEMQTRLSAAEARGLACVRRPLQQQDPWDIVVRSLCCPPPEVQKGRAARVRRLVPGSPAEARWWVIDFMPLASADGLLAIIGKLSGAADPDPVATLPLPEKLMALREGIRRRYSIESLAAHSVGSQLIEAQVRVAGEIVAPILICGEAGTGKQWIARVIHGQSTWHEQPFLVVDCRRLPAELIGDLCQAPGDSHRTIFLKEPQHLPRDYQLRLHEAIRAGADKSGPRVVAACSSAPAGEVAAGRLVQELYATLATLVIHVAPLRERMADLPLLVQQLLPRANGSQGACATALAPEASELLGRYAWPGNLRELYAALQCGCVRAKGNRIEAENLPAHIRLALRLDEVESPQPARLMSLDQILEMTERRLIVRALGYAKGNRNRAAELLSIWRPRLLRRMQALGIGDEPRFLPAKE
jgi:transcriptional regulator with PAS, ATPase and Fis domain